MALRLCITDWRNGFDDDETTRRCDLQSLSNRNPELGGTESWIRRQDGTVVPRLHVWSWVSVLGDLGGAGPWNANPNTPIGVWTQEVVNNGQNWHLFDPGLPPGDPGGTPRVIIEDGLFSFFAIDLRINACADAFADFILDWAPLAGLSGIHADYYVDPKSLGATSFADYTGATATQFILDFNAGIARVYQRIRDRMGESFIIVAQRDHPIDIPLDPADLRLQPISGYFIEQRIGQFQPFQDSFATVRGWLEEFNAWLAATYPTREPVHIIEYGGAGQDIPGRTNVSLDAELSGEIAEYDSGEIQTRDDYFEAHKALCEATGAYFSYQRDRIATFGGHVPSAGKVARTYELVPSGEGDYSEWSGGVDSWMVLADSSEATSVTENADGGRLLMTFTPLTLRSDQAVIDVSLTMRMRKLSGTSCDVKLFWSDGTELTGRDHRGTSEYATYTEENLPIPTDGQTWNDVLSAGAQFGIRCTDVAGSGVAEVSTVRLYVTVEETPQDDGAGYTRGRHRGRPKDNQKIIQKLSPPISEELFAKMNEPCPSCGSAVTRWTEGDRPYMYQTFREFRGTCSNGMCGREITIFG